MKKIVILFLAVIVVLGGAFFLLNKRASTDISTKYDTFSMIVGDNDIEISEFDRIDGQFYLSFDFIKKYIDDTIFYDENEQTVVFTNLVGTRIYKLNQNTGTINGSEIALRDPIIEKDGKILIPAEGFIYDYPVDLKFVKEKNVLLLDSKEFKHALGTPKRNNVKLREDESLSSPIVSNLTEEDIVYVYGETNNWYKVREIEGYSGFIRKKDLKVDFKEDKFKISLLNSLEEAPKKEPLNLTWDYTYGKETEDRIANIENLPGVNTICPTWFSIQNAGGDLIDRGNIEYINRYNSLGIDVWGYLDNSFNSEITHNALSSTKTREKIINNLYKLVKKYNMKGINIDFENTNISDRDLITQFMRELYAFFRKEKILVSIDVTPQISSDVQQEPYDRKELAESSDYVIVMAYDQHWGSSPVAGSVAEYKWVEGNINNLFRQIPMEKLVLGVPLYTRIWTEDNGEVSSVTATMSEVKKFVLSNNLNPEWDEDAMQYYVQNGNKKIWIEDEESINWKTSLVSKYSLAGIASWRLGFETSEIWNVIEKHLLAME